MGGPVVPTDELSGDAGCYLDDAINDIGPDHGMADGDTIGPAVGDAGCCPDDAINDIGADHGMADGDTIDDTDHGFLDSWDDAEEDASEFDIDEPEAE
ncbi:MAG: hypothetical protein ACPGU1_15045 [Myxococcota bacterium]